MNLRCRIKVVLKNELQIAGKKTQFSEVDIFAWDSQ